jgi:hypothetical protein
MRLLNIFDMGALIAIYYISDIVIFSKASTRSFGEIENLRFLGIE